MARFLCAVAVALAGTSVAAEARPVSYQGGWTVIQNTDRQNTALWAHYTVKPRLSLGYRGEWNRREDVLHNGVRATFLVNRWFGEDYQANIYLFADAGFAAGVGDNPTGARRSGQVGLMGDWETRRLFVSYMLHGYDAGDLGSGYMQSARFGVAPYVANTGALHTWLMVEIDHRPDNDIPVDVTPLVRFFKGPALFEAGWSVRDSRPLINFTYRF